MPASPRPSRRALLGAVLGVGAAGLTGCSTVRSTGLFPTPHASTASPAPHLDRTALLSRLSVSAGLFRALTSPALSGSSGDVRQWAASALAMTQQHMGVLDAADPLSPSPSSTAPPTPETAHPHDAAAALQAVARQQGSLETALTTACLATASGDLALLCASMAVGARATRAPGPLVTATRVRPIAGSVGTPTDATGILLTWVQALIQGLQTGLGRLPASDPRIAPGTQRLAAVDALRDQLQQQIDVDGGTPAPVAGNYAMPGPLTTPTQIVATWGLLEREVLSAWLRVAAAGSGTTRSTALAHAMDQLAQVAADGVGITWWPGWS